MLSGLLDCRPNRVDQDPPRDSRGPAFRFRILQQNLHGGDSAQEILLRRRHDPPILPHHLVVSIKPAGSMMRTRLRRTCVTSHDCLTILSHPRRVSHEKHRQHRSSRRSGSLWRSGGPVVGIGHGPADSHRRFSLVDGVGREGRHRSRHDGRRSVLLQRSGNAFPGPLPQRGPDARRRCHRDRRPTGTHAAARPRGLPTGSLSRWPTPARRACPAPAPISSGAKTPGAT